MVECPFSLFRRIRMLCGVRRVCFKPAKRCPVLVCLDCPDLDAASYW